MRVYDDGTYDTTNGDESGKLFDVPKKMKFKNLTINNNTYTFSEGVINGETKTYATIPANEFNTQVETNAVIANFTKKEQQYTTPDTSSQLNVKAYDSGPDTSSFTPITYQSGSPGSIYEYNILFVGEAHIGTKTSLIKRIKTGKFFDNIEDDKIYRENITYERDNKKIILYLIDTDAKNGKNLKLDSNYIINHYYDNADCIIMGYDITNKQSFEEIKSFWYNKIKEKNKTII
jgi:hypothetical protein